MVARRHDRHPGAGHQAGGLTGPPPQPRGPGQLGPAGPGCAQRACRLAGAPLPPGGTVAAPRERDTSQFATGQAAAGTSRPLSGLAAGRAATCRRRPAGGYSRRPSLSLREAAGSVIPSGTFSHLCVTSWPAAGPTATRRRASATSLWERMPWAGSQRYRLSSSGLCRCRRVGRGGRPWRARSAGGRVFEACRGRRARGVLVVVPARPGSG